MIPREIIDEVVSRNDIVDYIGSYVSLKRAGSNYTGCCPFHSEKTPSFVVYPSNQSFYCFGCSVGGSLITYVMKAENLTYVEAIEFLAKRAGITIPQNEKYEREGVSRKRIYEMNLEAAKFFRACLLDPNYGKEGLDYLMEKRKLTRATITHFGLGFAPQSFSMLGDHLRRKGFSEDELIAGFLRKRNDKGRAFDLFRNRVIFPVIDTTGNVIAFGGRVMDDSKPKYLNSSDTPGFKKSRNLYALNFAKRVCAEEMILCEGYMDVIALHAAGFENAVATLGTALTEEQARVMAKYTKRVIISYDSDEAGQRAANRAMVILGAVGLEVRVLVLEGAKDPDEYIKKYGADAFRRALMGSATGFEYKFRNVMAKYDVSVSEQKIRASQELSEIVASYYTPTEREVYLSRVADALSLPIDVLRNNVEILLRKKRKEIKAQDSRQAQETIRNFGDRVNPDAARFVQANAAEELIIGMMALYEEFRSQKVLDSVGLTSGDFQTAFHKRVFDEIVALRDTPGGFSLAVLGESFSPEELGRITLLMEKRRALTVNDISVFREGVAALKREKGRIEDNASEDFAAAILRRRREAKAKHKGDADGG
ncbi:MAG: DNA primase [Clostridia bacterium]|nr:DNA primase [Clostridia bacterium]